MVVGVTDGFRKELDIVGVGYRAAAKGPTRSSWRSASPTRSWSPPPRASTFVVPQPTRIEVHGIDKQLVGQVAADIRAWRKPEPYKGKGVRYVDEHVRRKAGKAGK
jgi:large subunit ribosomal protein L6